MCCLCPSLFYPFYFSFLRPLTTQLSIYWYEQKYELFYKQVRLLFAAMTVLGVIIIGLGYLIGTRDFRFSLWNIIGRI